MTTIAYKDGFLVSDSQVSDEDYLSRTYARKIVKSEEGIGGAAGGAWAGQVFMAWLMGEADPEDFMRLDTGEDFVGILITWDGQIRLYNRYLFAEVIDDKFYAVGSGSKIALPLMDYGASALDAVKLACKYDLYSGGKIETLTLEK